MGTKRKRSSVLRFSAYLWGFFALLSWCLGTTPEAYVAMFMVIAVICSVGSEILKEFGR